MSGVYQHKVAESGRSCHFNMLQLYAVELTTTQCGDQSRVRRHSGRRLISLARGIVKPHQSGTAWMPRANSQVPGCQRDPLTLSLGFGRRRGRLEVSSESCQKETGHYYFFRLLMLHVQWSRRLDSPRSATGLRARRSPLGTTIVAGYLTCRILVCSAA
jgi:hypothetical protein